MEKQPGAPKAKSAKPEPKPKPPPNLDETVAPDPEGEAAPPDVNPTAASDNDNLPGDINYPAAFDNEGEEKPAAKPAAKPTTKPAAAEQGKVSTLGDYKLLKKLGQGGMGAVFKAHQISLDREVAVKVLTKELSAKEAFVHRFIREARVMAKLDHPNILRCYEVKEANGLHYLSMELVDGGSIDGYLKKFGKFSLGDALYIFLACAHALQHAHELNLVHRDVKPENILVTRKGVIKVADLGLAKSQDDDQSLTRTGTGAGTPLYMPPEQARDVKRVDGRSDIYALGCMLYCFLTGKPPFSGNTVLEVIEAKEKGKFTPARRTNDEIPERLDLFIDKMVARNPDHRYQTCAEIIADVESLGLHNDSLSFLETDGAPAKPTGVLPRPAAKATMAPGPKAKSTMAPAAGKATAPKSRAAVTQAPEEPEEEEDDTHFWVKLKGTTGKVLNKKLSADQILALIKNNACDADTPVSRTQEGGYRAMATYPQFEPTLRTQKTKARAERKGEKFRNMYEQIEAEDRRRRKWRWLHNLMGKVGGGLGFLIWLAVLAGVAVGIYFLVTLVVLPWFGTVAGAK